MNVPDYKVCVLDAGEKGYSVGIYKQGGQAVFNSSCFEPNFSGVVSKLVKLANTHPEAFHQIDIHINSKEGRIIHQEESALKDLSDLIYSSFQVAKSNHT